MKSLTLLRHAKSSWSFEDIADIDRPLKPRGITDAEHMAHFLEGRGLVPDLVYSSDAARAIHTAILMSRHMRFDPEFIKLRPGIYMASHDQIMGIINTTKDEVDHLMVVGHAPGLPDLGVRLSGQQIAKFPTCGMMHIKLDTNSWSEVGPENGRLDLLEVPKNLRNN